MNPEMAHEQNIRATCAQMALSMHPQGPIEDILRDALAFFNYITVGVAKGETPKILCAPSVASVPVLTRPVITDA